MGVGFIQTRRNILVSLSGADNLILSCKSVILKNSDNDMTKRNGRMVLTAANASLELNYMLLYSVDGRITKSFVMLLKEDTEKVRNIKGQS